MITNRSRRGISNQFRPAAEILEGRSLMAAGQYTLYIPSAALGAGPYARQVLGNLPDGSIDVQRFNLNSTSPIALSPYGGGIGGFKIQFFPLDLVMASGPQSAGLFLAEATGARFNTMQLTLRDSAARIYETISIKSVAVTADALSGSSGDDSSLEDVKLQFGAIQVSTFDPAAPPTDPPLSQYSFSLITNSPSFNVPGVSALSLPNAQAAQVAVPKAQTVGAAAVSTSAATTIKLAVAKPHHGTTLLKAKVTSAHGVPTGNVTFYAGKRELGQVAAGAAGKATLSVPSAVLGTTKPFAIYSGGSASTFQPATTISTEAVYQKNFQKWLGRPMSQDEWVLTSIWSQQGYTPAKMRGIYQSLATS